MNYSKTQEQQQRQKKTNNNKNNNNNNDNDDDDDGDEDGDDDGGGGGGGGGGDSLGGQALLWGKKAKKPGKIGSLSSPIFYFAHADFFSPFTPMQSLIPGYGGGGGGDPSVVCI